jgi:hypothetical protein
MNQLSRASGHGLLFTVCAAVLVLFVLVTALLMAKIANGAMDHIQHQLNDPQAQLQLGAAALSSTSSTVTSLTFPCPADGRRAPAQAASMYSPTVSFSTRTAVLQPS